MINPITFGLIPSNAPKPKAAANPDNTEVYDYINPCSLIPLSEIHAITGNFGLKFNSKHAGLTTDLADAQLSTLVNAPEMPKLCMLDESSGNVKPSMFIGVMAQQSTEFYLQFRDSWNNGSLHAENVDTGGLPSAREASAIYIASGGHRFYTLLLVHTKYNQTLVVNWSGKDTVPVLRQLAYEALRTLDGSRYPGK
jgi:hypothetical protein